MNLAGIWNIKEVLSFDENGGKWISKEEYINDETVSDEMKEPLFCRILFEADGILKVLAPIPQHIPPEEIDRAAAAGEVQLFDSKTMIVEERCWKEENGKFYYDSGIQGEVLGEEFSPWMEIKETEDGIEWMTYRLVKAE